MAVYTMLSRDDAGRVAEAHDLGAVRGIHPVPAGTVNTNYLLTTEFAEVFVRIYEHQDTDGVAYEWALLEHLVEAGLPVPHRVAGPGPGVLRVSGKPTAIFEVVGGIELCQARVRPVHAHAVGRFLGRAHLATRDFRLRRESRYGLLPIRGRLAWGRGEARRLGRDDLLDAITRLERATDELLSAEAPEVERGVIHGDLFRDNARWSGESLLSVLDWESASDGPLVYDLAVAILAWCFDDAMNWELARALVAGYLEERTLPSSERAALRVFLRFACIRFAATRITDIALRPAASERPTKDYRRFLARLDAIEAETVAGLGARLALPRHT